MISIGQIRAARGLLGWSQSELANRSGLSQRAITTLETSKHRPNSGTLDAIEKVLLENGIELISDGVRLKNPTSFVLEGGDMTDKIFQFTLDTLRGDRRIKEVLASGLNQALLSEKARKQAQTYLSNIDILGVTERILVSEDFDTDFSFGSLSRYRALKRDYFSANSPTFIFGNYYAMMLPDVQKIVVVHNENMAHFQRKIFENLWQNAKPFPEKTK